MSTLFLEREIHPFDILFRNLFESNTHFKPAVESKIPHPLDIYEDKEGLHFEIACTGLSKEDVKKYIRYIADRRLISLGLKGIFKVKRNPLPWVEEMINAPTHTNFFENRATDYAKGALSGDWGDVWAH